MDPASEPSLRVIGKYDVRGELGQGGMAVVYRAHDPALDRDVAVKVLHPHLAKDPESRMRFEREARAAARLRHPNIVEVYEFSEGAGEAYMVTELLEGPTLRRFFETHRDLPAEVVAAVGVVLCDALACAHAQGVVHRDVKPDNLLLSKGRLKLTDFGIAHVADQREMTATGQVLGSPAHMAPEQIEGADVDARTDLFAAGTVLYLLSTGRLPFDGPNPHSLLRKILDSDYADPLRVAPRIGHRFAAIIRQAMSRIPSDRYADATAMRAALTSFLAEVGWEDPPAELDRFFADPDGVAAALRNRLLARLPDLGVAARQRGDVQDALGYFNRALALDPGNARVLGLVRGAARSQQRKKVLRAAGIVGGAAIASATLGLALLERLAPRSRPTTHPAMVLAPEPPRTPPALAFDAATPAAPDVIPARTPPTAARAPFADASVSSVAVRVPTRAAERLRHPDAAVVEPTRLAVSFHPIPPNVMYSVNGAAPREFRNDDMPLRLPVGQRATVVFSGEGWESYTWSERIDPGHTDPEVRFRMHRHAVPAP